MAHHARTKQVRTPPDQRAEKHESDNSAKHFIMGRDGLAGPSAHAACSLEPKQRSALPQTFYIEPGSRMLSQIFERSDHSHFPCASNAVAATSGKNTRAMRATYILQATEEENVSFTVEQIPDSHAHAGQPEAGSGCRHGLIGNAAHPAAAAAGADG